MAKTKVTKAKFLVVENMTGSDIVFRHPVSEKMGREDLVLHGWDTEVIGDFWLDVAWFVRMVNEGSIRTYRADVPPSKRQLIVPIDLVLEDRMLDGNALMVVGKDKFDTISQAIVNVEPHNSANIVDKEWLKNVGIVFLRNIISREKQWRARPEVIKACEARIAQINDL